MNDLPLFAQPYPLSPGYARCSATSREAARGVAKGVNALHTRVLLALLRHGPMTPDAIAALIGEHILKVRPRCTELCKPEWGNLLVATGEERPSALGNAMDVLRLTDAGQTIAERLADPVHASTIAAQSPQTHATPTLKNGTHAR